MQMILTLIVAAVSLVVSAAPQHNFPPAGPQYQFFLSSDPSVGLETPLESNGNFELDPGAPLVASPAAEAQFFTFPASDVGQPTQLQIGATLFCVNASAVLDFCDESGPIWQVNPVGPNNATNVVEIGSGKCWTLASSSLGTPITLSECDQSSSQTFQALFVDPCGGDDDC